MIEVGTGRYAPDALKRKPSQSCLYRGAKHRYPSSSCVQAVKKSASLEETSTFMVSTVELSRRNSMMQAKKLSLVDMVRAELHA